MIRAGGAAIFLLEVAGEMEPSISKRVEGASRRFGLRLRVAVAAAVFVLAIIPGLTPAQEEQSPTPMETPDMMMLPSVALYPDPPQGPAPLVAGFVPEIHDPSGSEIVFYKWNFGDGHVATTPPLITYNTFANPGLYVVSLTIVTVDGRSATGFTSVNVQAPASE
jgi:hypothetical protein